jgi:hypothetical protein
LFKKSTISLIASLLLVILLYGFPVQSTVPFLLKTNSNPINIAFRAFFLAVSLFLIFPHLFRRVERINIGWVFFLGFWLLYSIRLIYDIEIKGEVFLDTDSFYVYSFAFGSCLIPSVAFFLNARYLNIESLIKTILITLLISNVCLAFDIMAFNNWNIAQVLLTRAWVVVDVNGEDKKIINAITVSYYGALLAIVCIHFLRLGLLKKVWKKFIAGFGIGLGIFNLIIGASRGPMIVFLLLLTFELIITQRKFDLSKLLKSSLLIGSIVTMAVFFLKYSDTEDIQLLSRLQETANTLQSNEKEERNYEWASSWRQFNKNPILGDKFVNDYDKSYSHNFFLDVTMSTGIFGLSFVILLFWFFIPRLVFSIKVIKTFPYLSFLFLLYLGEFTIAMLSGGIFAVTNFWLLISLFLGLRLTKKV